MNHQAEDITEESNISWSAYHTVQSTGKCEKSKGDMSTCLLPLFYEVAHSEAMISHSMKVVKQAVTLLNSNQTPVIAMDQPLFAIAKRIQWNLPTLYGEDKFVIMFGGLHIEMAALKLLGDLLDGSGWTTAITEVGIASSGTANSCLKVSHVTKTRHAHQVTAASLYKLLKKSFLENCNNEDSTLTIKE